MRPVLAATPALADHAGAALREVPIVEPAAMRADPAAWNSAGIGADEAFAAARDAEAGGQSIARLLPVHAPLTGARIALVLRADSALYRDAPRGRFAFLHVPLGLGGRGHAGGAASLRSNGADRAAARTRPDRRRRLNSAFLVAPPVLGQRTDGGSRAAMDRGPPGFTPHQAHGAVFVRLEPGPDPAPLFRAPFGTDDHDHFWWDQGEWRGTAFDAIENVLDPFHTSELHHGFIRRRDRRNPVTLTVENFERGVEMTIDQSRPDLGLMSRMLERDRTRSRTRYDAPTVVQAVWEGRDRLTLCVTAYFTPVTRTSFRTYACFTTARGVLPAWLKRAGLKAFLLPVVRQDRKALAAQADVVARFGTTRYAQGPGDLLGGRIHKIYNGHALVPGVTDRVTAEL